MLGKLLGLAVILVVGFFLTVKGNPSYWQIIGLLLMVLPVGAAAALNLSQNKESNTTDKH